MYIWWMPEVRLRKKTGQYQIIPWLKYIGTRSVEGIFITHWDEDHISAVGELLEWSKSSRVKIRRIFLPDVALKDEVLETLLQQIEEAEVSVEYLSAGEHMTDGALQISCLHPYAKKCRRIATMRRWCCACHRAIFRCC